MRPPEVGGSCHHVAIHVKDGHDNTGNTFFGAVSIEFDEAGSSTILEENVKPCRGLSETKTFFTYGHPMGPSFKPTNKNF